ncbi:MAG: ABC transporter substrate-binding protein [Janthinobacterium lividum]
MPLSPVNRARAARAFTSVQGGAVATLAMAVIAGFAAPASAQSRDETLRYVTGGSVNTLDPTLPGATRESFGVGMSLYDRLVGFDRKQVDGKWVFDLNHLHGELAKSFSISPDGLTLTFHLDPAAKWQDGSPVTADDVKWSLDRAVSAKSLAKPQMLTGSLTSPDQFKVVDAHTVQITLPKADRLALPDLATVYPIMINSKLAKAHATPDDPWAQNWLKDHAAGSGPYAVQTFVPGQQVVLQMVPGWNRGQGGKGVWFKRIIEQTVPEATTRATLVERGDADLVIDLQANDAVDVVKRGKLQVISTPQYNSVTYVIFNNQMAPFNNLNVRRAVAYALPYDDMFKGALFGRGQPLFGGAWPDGKSPSPDYPVRQPVKTDLALAKKYLAAAGMPNGFTTDFSYNVGQSATAEPMAALIKESLAKVGITVNIHKLPDAESATAINNKTLPFFTEQLTAWLPSTDYWYRYSYTGDQRWNYSSLNNPELEKLANEARFETDPKRYADDAKRLNEIAFAAMPEVPLWTANQDAVMAKSIHGYTYQFYKQVDFRDLSR